MKKYNTIQEYIDSFPNETQKKLQELRSIISTLSPKANETIKYGIPTYLLDGSYLIYFSGNKKHIGMYPIPTGNETFQKKLEPYKTGKSTIQFPIDKPFPQKLIEEILSYSTADNQKRTMKKKSKK